MPQERRQPWYLTGQGYEDVSLTKILLKTELKKTINKKIAWNNVYICNSGSVSKCIHYCWVYLHLCYQYLYFWCLTVSLFFVKFYFPPGWCLLSRDSELTGNDYVWIVTQSVIGESKNGVAPSKSQFPVGMLGKWKVVI